MEFVRLRSLVKSLACAAYKGYVRRLGETIVADPRRFWSYVNSRRGSTRIGGVMRDGNGALLDNPQMIVNSFADYFASVFTPPSDNALDFHSCLPLISVPSFSELDIETSIGKLKGGMTSGPDGIPAFLVKDCSAIFAPILSKLFNLALKTLTFPTDWKTARVCPVWKSGDKGCIENFRPISLISNFAKIFEISVYSFVFASVKNYIASEQHGFVANRSTSSNLTYFTQFISNILDSRGQVDVAYTDFSKAFDRVSHGVLCAKLKLFNFSPDFVAFISSYLNNRHYFVRYNGFTSESYIGTSGVPQGSTLGPLLFLLFINDLPSILRCHSLLYADDLKLFTRVDSSFDVTFLQNQLDSLWQWCIQNELELNVSKCKVMTYTRQNEPVLHSYSLGSSEVERVVVFKDLGVYFDSQLTFINHVQETVKSSHKMLGFIIRNSDQFMGVHVLKSLYYAFVRSKLEYCSTVWSPYYEIHKLAVERVQRKFLKYLYFKTYGSYPERGYSGDLLRQEFGLVSLEKRRVMFGLSFLVNLVRRTIDCPALLNLITFRVPRSGSRQGDVFLCPQPRTNLMLKSPVYVMTKCFNRISCQFDIFESSVRELRALVEVYF